MAGVGRTSAAPNGRKLLHANRCSTLGVAAMRGYGPTGYGPRILGYGYPRGLGQYERFEPKLGLCNWREQLRFLKVRARSNLTAAKREAEKSMAGKTGTCRFRAAGDSEWQDLTAKQLKAVTGRK